MNALLPTLDDIRDAAARIAGRAATTPVLSNALLNELSGARLFFKCENLQRGGAFKFRGACNAVWALPADDAERGVVTHSSGNHGNALAMAARTRGIPAHVVVPKDVSAAKLANIERAGATIHMCAPNQDARERMAAEVQASTGATLIHPYVNTEVMAGQGTLVLELLQQAPGLDALIMPISGGGLAAGCAIAAHGLDPSLSLFGAEPEGADDAARAVAAGTRVPTPEPKTLCDGLRAPIGAPNLRALIEHQMQVITVSDEQTIAAMKLLWQHLKQVVEVSSATVLAAILAQPERFEGRRIGVVLSGGNVDVDKLPW